MKLLSHFSLLAICVLFTSCVKTSTDLPKVYSEVSKVGVLGGLLNSEREQSLEDHPVYVALRKAKVSCTLGDHQARMTQLICPKDEKENAIAVINALPEKHRRLVWLGSEKELTN